MTQGMTQGASNSATLLTPFPMKKLDYQSYRRQSSCPIINSIW
ncbi:MAG TPA: hypothetical protein VKG02_06535 [Blastocatellia bacterium]|nr:hypothetical protein [Blastocatellia bacterium]